MLLQIGVLGNNFLDKQTILNLLFPDLVELFYLKMSLLLFKTSSLL